MRMDPDASRHWKLNELRQRLGDPAFINWYDLIGFTAKHKPDGNLGLDVAKIEKAAHWTGAAGVFLEALVKLQLVDQDLYGYHIHNWVKRQPYIEWLDKKAQRSASARYAANCRWQKETPQSTEVHRSSPTAPQHSTEVENHRKNHRTKLPSDAPAYATYRSPSTDGTGTTATAAAPPPVPKAAHNNSDEVAHISELLALPPGPRKPQPTDVSEGWELWKIAGSILQQLGWNDAERRDAVKFGRERGGPEPDFLWFRHFIASCCYISRTNRQRPPAEHIRKKVAYLQGFKKENWDEDLEAAKVAIESEQLKLLPKPAASQKEEHSGSHTAGHRSFN